MPLLTGSKRRLLPFIAVAFFLVLVFALYAKPEHARSAAQYVKDKSKHLYDGLTEPDWHYITGSKDPENWREDQLASDDSYAPNIPSKGSKISGAGKFDLEDEDASEELQDWYENPDIHEIEIGPVSETHYTIESISGEDGKFFEVDFLGRTGLNPNVIPHPHFDDKWIMVALQNSLWGDDIHSALKVEMVCLATLQDGKLVCDDHPTTLPIRATMSGNCDVPDSPIVGLVSLSVGPHDARVFFGPESPFIMYGSLSNHHNVCLGQWLQDFRPLVEWGPFVGPWSDYGVAKDVQRPPPTRVIEKNYFVFWSSDGRMYVHYDLEPRRVFAQIDLEGRAGKNLAQRSRKSDERCWNRWLESTPFANGTHQATNSLSVTLCKSSDPGCRETDDNTFIMHVFQKKLNYDGHSYYLPYILLFHRTPPFAMYAITQKPFWMKGQRAAGEPIADGEEDAMDHWEPVEHHEQIYITSMNWKQKDKNYHGYLDDVLFLTFGREDTWMQAMDLTPESLIGELLVC